MYLKCYNENFFFWDILRVFSIFMLDLQPRCSLLYDEKQFENGTENYRCIVIWNCYKIIDWILFSNERMI